MKRCSLRLNIVNFNLSGKLMDHNNLRLIRKHFDKWVVTMDLIGCRFTWQPSTRWSSCCNAGSCSSNSGVSRSFVLCDKKNCMRKKTWRMNEKLYYLIQLVNKENKISKTIEETIPDGRSLCRISTLWNTPTSPPKTVHKSAPKPNNPKLVSRQNAI